MICWKIFFAQISQSYYTKAQLSFHTQPTWIIIVGIDKEYIVLNNRKHILPSVFSRPSTLLLPHLPHNKYNLLHSIRKFICYNLLDPSIFLTTSSVFFLQCDYPTNAQHLQPTSDPPYHRSCPSHAPKSKVGHTLPALGGSAPRPRHRRHCSPHGLTSLFLGPLPLWLHLQPLLPSLLPATYCILLSRLPTPSLLAYVNSISPATITPTVVPPSLPYFLHLHTPTSFLAPPPPVYHTHCYHLTSIPPQPPHHHLSSFQAYYTLSLLLIPLSTTHAS